MYIEPTTNTSRLSPLNVQLIYLHGIIAYTSTQMCARYTHEQGTGNSNMKLPSLHWHIESRFKISRLPDGIFFRPSLIFDDWPHFRLSTKNSPSPAIKLAIMPPECTIFRTAKILDFFWLCCGIIYRDAS
jgi:hypothetical protein